LNQEIQTVKDNAVDQEILVTKRDGSKESIDLEKIHRVVHWASQDLENISVSQVEINAQLAFFDGIKTEDIHETIIKSAADLDKPEYTVVTKLGVTGEIATKKFFKKAKIITFETESDAASEVLNGKADGMVYDQPYNILFMSDKGKDKLVHLDTPLTYEPLGWAIRKGDPDFLNWLNNFLRQIKGDKVVDFHEKLNEKWLRDTSWLKRVQ